MINSHDEWARKAWDELVRTASLKSTCSYKNIGQTIGIHHRVVKYALSPIQDYCLANNLPPLTVLVINATGKPGSGFIAANVDRFDEIKKEVYLFNWNKIINPFDYAKLGFSQDSIIDDLVEDKPIPKEILALVTVRGVYQTFFRKALLKAYDGKCCICGLAIEDALEAAHIIPYSDCVCDDQKIAVTNGLLLCATHHKLFDNGKIKILEDYTIQINGINSKIEENNIMVGKYNGRRINLPINTVNYPLIEYLTKIT